MSQPMNVPIAQMLGASAAFQTQLGEMQRQLRVLEGRMDELSRSWDGASKLAYAELRQQWQQGAQQLNQVGQQFSAAIGSSGRKFIDAEARNLDAISRTRARNNLA